MSILESAYVAFFLLSIVFIVLFSLYLCIRVFSVALMKLETYASRTKQNNGN